MKIELITTESEDSQNRLTDCSPGDCSPVNIHPATVKQHNATDVITIQKTETRDIEQKVT